MKWLCKVNQKIISCSLFMGKNNGLWQYARAIFFYDFEFNDLQL